MIECSNENIYFKKRPKNKKILSVFLFVFIIIGGFFYYRTVVVENIFNICKNKVFESSNDCVNKAILAVFDQEINYDDFIDVEKNQLGEIVLIKANSYKINTVNKQIVSVTKTNLENKLKEGVEIPFMAFTGLKLFSGYGKIINFKALTVDSVTSEFESKFESVGINQTLHSIYVKVQCEINLHTAGKEKREIIETRVLISESILVGKVPEVYINGKLFN